ncbi:MAG: DJ-1/PfpI family protein [Bacillota bacterium]|nr:DJ-1/PfpI family protein [Bacillota bacterium]
MVYVHLAKGYEEIEALTVVDILRRGGVDAKLVSIEEKLEVQGAHGINVSADITFEQADYSECSMIVLPGGMPGAANLENHEKLMEHICQMAEGDGMIGAICASPAIVLAPHGILKGRRATVYPGMESAIEKGGGIYVSDGVVRDGNIITGKGPAFAAEFAVAILEAIAGHDTAADVADGFLI